MIAQRMTLTLTETIDRLADPQSLQGLFHQHQDGNPLPSSKRLEEIINLSRSILFPGYFGKSQVNIETIQYQIGVSVEKLYRLLAEQILAGLCYSCNNGENIRCSKCKAEAEKRASLLIEKFPELRRILGTDVTAAFNGDPAAKSTAEIISCYPVIKTLTNYRIAHELFKMEVPLIPRMLTEMAHSETGIDIHPGATIGSGRHAWGQELSTG